MVLEISDPIALNSSQGRLCQWWECMAKEAVPGLLHGTQRAGKKDTLQGTLPSEIPPPAILPAPRRFFIHTSVSEWINPLMS